MSNNSLLDLLMKIIFLDNQDSQNSNIQIQSIISQSFNRIIFSIFFISQLLINFIDINSFNTFHIMQILSFTSSLQVVFISQIITQYKDKEYTYFQLISFCSCQFLYMLQIVSSKQITPYLISEDFLAIEFEQIDILVTLTVIQWLISSFYMRTMLSLFLTQSIYFGPLKEFIVFKNQYLIILCQQIICDYYKVNYQKKIMYELLRRSEYSFQTFHDLRNKAAALEYNISELDAEMNEMQQENEDLMYQANIMTTPDQIKRKVDNMHTLEHSSSTINCILYQIQKIYAQELLFNNTYTGLLELVQIKEVHSRLAQSLKQAFIDLSLSIEITIQNNCINNLEIDTTLLFQVINLWVQILYESGCKHIKISFTNLQTDEFDHQMLRVEILHGMESFDIDVNPAALFVQQRISEFILNTYGLENQLEIEDNRTMTQNIESNLSYSDLQYGLNQIEIINQNPTEARRLNSKNLSHERKMRTKSFKKSSINRFNFNEFQESFIMQTKESNSNNHDHVFELHKADLNNNKTQIENEKRLNNYLKCSPLTPQESVRSECLSNKITKMNKISHRVFEDNEIATGKGINFIEDYNNQDDVNDSNKENDSNEEKNDNDQNEVEIDNVQSKKEYEYEVKPERRSSIVVLNEQKNSNEDSMISEFDLIKEEKLKARKSYVKSQTNNEHDLSIDNCHKQSIFDSNPEFMDHPSIKDKKDDLNLQKEDKKIDKQKSLNIQLPNNANRQERFSIQKNNSEKISQDKTVYNTIYLDYNSVDNQVVPFEEIFKTTGIFQLNVDDESCILCMNKKLFKKLNVELHTAKNGDESIHQIVEIASKMNNGDVLNFITDYKLEKEQGDHLIERVLEFNKTLKDVKTGLTLKNNIKIKQQGLSSTEDNSVKEKFKKLETMLQPKPLKKSQVEEIILQSSN